MVLHGAPSRMTADQKVGGSNLRWDDIESALSAIPGTGHDWDVDPSSWVRGQRRGYSRRAG